MEGGRVLSVGMGTYEYVLGRRLRARAHWVTHPDGSR